MQYFEKLGQVMNEALHTRLKCFLKILCKGKSRLKEVKEGEYVAQNEQTGDKLCLLFLRHKHLFPARNSRKPLKAANCTKTIITTSIEDCCPYKNYFVLEFPLF